MPPQPKRKLSKGRRDRRRSHMALTAIHLVECTQCHEPKLPHRVCLNCGTYDGIEVLEMKTQKAK
ncbi:MAG: 50S ribosomal protein L32 [Chloroflexi bacterium]|nr:50S ribosomal protein L32 [Chloroflexota bacterium]MBI3734755.1 50S ribosomal protein L32 [Chloroflexota bacterium]